MGRIRRALMFPRRAVARNRRGLGRFPHARTLAVLPAVLLSVLPALPCPCAALAWSGAIGSCGLSLLAQPQHLIPLTAACATLAVGGLVLGARRRGDYRPVLLGLVGAGLLLTGKFWLASAISVGTGAVLLVIAALANGRPRNRPRRLCLLPDGHVALKPTLPEQWKVRSEK